MTEVVSSDIALRNEDTSEYLKCQSVPNNVRILSTSSCKVSQIRYVYHTIRLLSEPSKPDRYNVRGSFAAASLLIMTGVIQFTRNVHSPSVGARLAVYVGRRRRVLAVI